MAFSEAGVAMTVVAIADARDAARGARRTRPSSGAAVSRSPLARGDRLDPRAARCRARAAAECAAAESVPLLKVAPPHCVVWS